MQRNISELQNKTFDIVIIGGGIYGASAAREATLRGLSVALVEKNDFGGATSSNSLKIIHGGLRYLQHADFKRMRESIRERKILMKIAPHLVHPLPCIMPTYGHALKGKESMSIALFLNDLIGFDRNGLADPDKFMPRGKVVSKDECKTIIPGVDEDGLTGGAIWYDCQVDNSERLLLAMLRSAVEKGASVANYVEMTGFKIDNNKITGIAAKDNLTGETFEISSKLVINNAGPWFNDVLDKLNGHRPKTEVKLSAAMNLVVKRKLFSEFAVGISSQYESKDDDALVNKGSRLFFITPWNNYTIIGTTHVHHEGGPENFKITEKDIQEFIDDVNEAYPPAKLKREDISFHYGGLLPMDGYDAKTGNVNLLKSYEIIDHSNEGGLKGLLSVVSVKYTTARDVAEKTIEYAAKKLGRKFQKTEHFTSAVFGGEISDIKKYIEKEKARGYGDLEPEAIEHLIRNYGSKYGEVIKYISENAEWKNPILETLPVLKAEVIHAVREEMAIKLADVVRRRTELGSAGNPGDAALKICAELMAVELSWAPQKIEDEIAYTKDMYLTTNN